MAEKGQGKRIIERLREGEKIRCELCKEGYFTTVAKDISKSHGFSCSKCNSMINDDPILGIE